LDRRPAAYSLGLESELIVVRHSGPLTVAVIKESRRDVARLGAEKGLHRVLLDLSAASSSLGVTDIFELCASQLDELPRGTTVAVVHRPGQFEAEDGVFAEDVSVNRGARLRVFADPRAAREWLSGGSTALQ